MQGVEWGKSLPPVLLLHGTKDACGREGVSCYSHEQDNTCVWCMQGVEGGEFLPPVLLLHSTKDASGTEGI